MKIYVGHYKVNSSERHNAQRAFQGGCSGENDKG